jgi:hypothetical protein
MCRGIELWRGGQLGGAAAVCAASATALELLITLATDLKVTMSGCKMIIMHDFNQKTVLL